MPRTQGQRVDTWADERRAAGMSEEDINFMRSGGRTEIPGTGQGDQGQDAGDDQGQGDDDQDQGGQGTQGDQGPGAGQGDGGGQTQQTQQTRQEDEDPEDEVTASQPVPYQKFRREQKKLRDRLAARDGELNTTRGQLQEFQTRFARLDERMRIFQDAATASNAADQETGEEVVPNAEEDPIGAINYVIKKLGERQQETQEVRQRVETRDSMEQLQSAYVSDARQFASTEPAFAEAYQWLIRMRNEQLAAAGIDDPNERANIINSDERDLVARALQDRQRNPQSVGPAQRLFNFAKASGFRPTQQRQNGRNQNSNGQVNQRRQQNNGAGDTERQPSVTEQVDAIERGRTASRSLSGAGGAAPRQGLDINSLIDMTDEEFAAWRRTLTPAQMKEYQGVLGAPERGSSR